jgi:hypothetical protein
MGKEFLKNVMELKHPSISTVNVYTMTSQQILQSDMLDILFEDRNKLSKRVNESDGHYIIASTPVAFLR